MIKRYYILIPLLLCFIYSDPANAQSSPKVKWYTIEEAEALARKEPKKIMIDVYTDWCGWCKKLENEVFNTKEFAEKAGESFVFLKVDFPMYARQASHLKEQNEELKRKHSVRGFPTVVLLDDSIQVREGLQC